MTGSSIIRSIQESYIQNVDMPAGRKSSPPEKGMTYTRILGHVYGFEVDLARCKGMSGRFHVFDFHMHDLEDGWVQDDFKNVSISGAFVNEDGVLDLREAYENGRRLDLEPVMEGLDKGRKTHLVRKDWGPGNRGYVRKLSEGNSFEIVRQNRRATPFTRIKAEQFIRSLPKKEQRHYVMQALAVTR